jgi:hypothetical protein
MNWARSLLFLCLFAPVLSAQGVRMSADFLPLSVGNRWVYDIVNQDGKKLTEVDFSVREHTIVKGRSFYVLTRFPFVLQGGDQIHLVRFDKSEKQFLRVLEDEEGPLFLSDGSSTEVIEADSGGLPTKFVLHSGAMDVTFQRGVGIIEVRIQGGNGLQIAKIASARVGEGVGPGAIASDNRQPAPAPAVDRPPSAAQQAGIPLPKTPEQRSKDRAELVGSITDDNPLLIVDAGEVPEGHKIVMQVRNISDKLLPFSFTTQQSFDFAVVDAATGQEVWRWSETMFFQTQVKRTTSIPPQGMWRFEAVWNHRDKNRNLVAPGEYKIVGYVTTKPEIESDAITIEVK